jgi:hypothetical protein
MARSGPSGFNPSTAMEATAKNSRVRSATPNGLCSPERLPSWSFRTGVRTLPTGPAQRTAWIGVPMPYGLHWPESGLSASGANGNANHWVGAQFLISRSTRCTSWGRFQISARSIATPTSASTQNRGASPASRRATAIHERSASNTAHLASSRGRKRPNLLVCHKAG